MVKLIGRTKINCAVFISGRGTNLKSIFKYSKTIKSFTTLFSIIVPLGFIFIALFHHLNAL